MINNDRHSYGFCVFLVQKSALQLKLFQNGQQCYNESKPIYLCCHAGIPTALIEMQWSLCCALKSLRKHSALSDGHVKGSWSPCRRQELYSKLLLARTCVQLWEDAFGDHSCPDHVKPGEATGGGEHSDVIHKLLMEAPPFVTELRPWEVTAEPLHASLSLSQTQEHTTIITDALMYSISSILMLALFKVERLLLSITQLKCSATLYLDNDWLTQLWHIFFCFMIYFVYGDLIIEIFYLKHFKNKCIYMVEA